MNAFLWGNFDFEHELASSSYAPNRNLQRLAAELSCHLLGLAETGDAVCLPVLPPVEFLTAFQRQFEVTLTCVESPLRAAAIGAAVERKFQPWGWSDAARRVATQIGAKIDAPSSEAVRLVNSRRVSVEIERELGLDLAGSRVIRAHADLEISVAHCARRTECSSDTLRWVIKAEFGMSARERVVGCGTELSEPTRRWIEKRLEKGEWLIFEPWLDRVSEFGILMNIPQSTDTKSADAQVELLAVTELLTDSTGRYVGSQCLPNGGFEQAMPHGELIANAVTEVKRFARRIAQLGYFGPLGIDVMLYRNHLGELAIRPIQDVNARYTMGFIARRLCERVAHGEHRAWVLIDSARLAEAHATEIDCSFERRVADAVHSPLRVPLPQSVGDVVAIRTSPVWLGDQSTRQVGVVIAANTSTELMAARAWFNNTSR